MAKIPQEVQDAFNAIQLVSFATASADGQPNCCIVGMKKLLDDETIYLSDQFFKKTLANIQANDKASVMFYNKDCAYQIHGTMQYVNEGEMFEEQAAWVNALFEKMGRPVKAKGGVILHVEAVYNTMSGPQAGEQIA